MLKVINKPRATRVKISLECDIKQVENMSMILKNNFQHKLVTPVARKSY
jgi:hypothetical protein